MGNFPRCLFLVAGIFAILACPAARAWSPGTGNPNATSGFLVNATNRMDVLGFYHTVYAASEGYAGRINWTGNVTTGVAGTTSDTFKNDVLRRVNFYRALVGLPADIVFSTTKSSKCQDAALMFSANGSINHYPSSSWTFYTANGAEAARNANIAYGMFGPGAIDGFMADDNVSDVGHRRWIIYSLSAEMGTGDVPDSAGKRAANALWVIGDFKTSATPKFAAWPNKGFVPRSLVPEQWSLSYPKADFTSASVAMTCNGSSVPLSIVSSSGNSGSYTGDSTIVWEPEGLDLSGAADVTCNVTVSGIGGGIGVSSYSYSVTMFDPSVLGQSVVISGPDLAPPTGQYYSFNKIQDADAYALRVSAGAAGIWSEGAENLSFITSGVSSYALDQAEVKNSGFKAFHLTFPSFSEGEQGFEIDREFIPTTTSELSFYDLFRYVTSTSRLSAEVSDDSGVTWREVWGRNGNGKNSSTGWDSSFNARAVSLSSYAGKMLRLRFVFRRSGTVFLGTSTDKGVFLDDISVTSATQLVNTKTITLAGSASSFMLDNSTAGAPLADGATYYLRISPNVGTRWFGDGPIKVVRVQTGAPTATPTPTPLPTPTPTPTPAPTPSPTPTGTEATVVLGHLRQTYDGQPKAVFVETVPAGLATTVTYNGSTALPVNAGTYAVVATIDDPDFAGSVSGVLVVTKAAQSVSFDDPGAKVFSKNATFRLTASSSAGLPTRFTSAKPAIVSIAGNTATIKGAGSALLTATNAGDANYLAAGASRTVTVDKAAQSIPAFVASSGAPYGTVLTFTNNKSSAGFPVTYALVSGPAKISGNKATITGVGTVVVSASQGGNANYHPAPVQTGTFPTRKAEQAIKFTLAASKAFAANVRIPLKATSSSGLKVSFTSGNTNIMVISEGNAVIKGRGTNTVTASQAGNTNYNAATDVVRTIVVK